MADVEQEQADQTQEQSIDDETPPEQEQAQTEESAESANDNAEEGTEAESANDNAEEPPKPDAQAQAQQHKRTGGFQRKIERLERELAAFRASQQQQPPPAQQQPGKEKSPEEKATEYIDNLVEQRLAARETQRQQQAQQAEFQRRTADVRAKHPDFDDVLADVAHIPVHSEVQRALLTVKNGPDIMYQLASNPAELERLSSLPPFEATLEVLRLEAKSASGGNQQKPKSPTRPPAPPSKVGGSSANTRNLDDLSLSDYKRAYRAGKR